MPHIANAKAKLATALFGLGVFATRNTYALSLQKPFVAPGNESHETCKQVAAVFPTKHASLDRSLGELYSTPEFKLNAIDSLSQLIRVPSVSYDDMGAVGQDPRWDTFKELHAHLEARFPRVFTSLNVTKVNTYGLVLRWQGSNPSLKPILTTAHQDVVPVEPSTLDQWNNPPWSGFYDGKYVWGRGSVDDKPDIVSQLTTIDTLLKHSFEPTRTFVFAYGFDEESGGSNGAAHIGRYLEASYGHDSFAALLDEGFGFEESPGKDRLFAIPCTGEKGYHDVSLVVNTPGGHSSVPPPHTAIGILAQAIVQLEAHPHQPALQRTGTVFQQIQCQAKYDSTTPEKVRRLAERAAQDDGALKELEAELLASNPMYPSILATTQAVDIVNGGVKVNALPEKVEAVINHRIAEHSSVKSLQGRITSVVLPIAKKNNLTLIAFGTTAYEGSAGAGEIVLSSPWVGHAFDPSPVTPTFGAAPWDLLGGTIQAALKSSPQYSDRELVVVPTFALGNTDTKAYWNLTRHIFRYSHTNNAGVYNGMHTVNEAIWADNIVEKIRFHTKWILNWDESEL